LKDKIKNKGEVRRVVERLKKRGMCGFRLPIIIEIDEDRYYIVSCPCLRVVIRMAKP